MGKRMRLFRRLEQQLNFLMLPNL
uniref:ABC transporter family protein n=1 Tax=Rhizophora mucronata TaxID=61149 RepID=A0A2P2MWT3_RHIMU